MILLHGELACGWGRQLGKAQISEHIGIFAFSVFDIAGLPSITMFRYKNSFYPCLPAFSYEAYDRDIVSFMCHIPYS